MDPQNAYQQQAPTSTVSSQAQGVNSIPPQTPQKKSRLWLWIIVTVVVLLIGVGIGMAFHYYPVPMIVPLPQPGQ